MLVVVREVAFEQLATRREHGGVVLAQPRLPVGIDGLEDRVLPVGRGAVVEGQGRVGGRGQVAGLTVLALVVRPLGLLEQ